MAIGQCLCGAAVDVVPTAAGGLVEHPPPADFHSSSKSFMIPSAKYVYQSGTSRTEGGERRMRPSGLASGSAVHPSDNAGFALRSAPSTIARPFVAPEVNHPAESSAVLAPATKSEHAAPTLSAASLGGQRGERPLFKDVELTLRPGQVVWLRGRNGRGKTSLLRLLAGLTTPAQGAVLCDGRPLSALPAQWRQRLVYIAHASALKDDMTVSECLQFTAALQGRKPAAGEIDAALSCWGIERLRDAPVRTLSQGQRRRTALARLALPHPPSIWLLDEPFDALDDEGVQTLCGLLSAQARCGGSVVLTSHQAVPLRDPTPLTLDLDGHAIAA
jgi:heme exporter protein A